jgi:two-component system, response regulator
MKGSANERCVGSPGLFVRHRCLCGKGPPRYALRDLLDLSLPRLDGLDGLGLLREMRAHEQTRLIPVVAFSSADERQEADVVYGSGANSYIGTRPGFGPFEEVLEQVAHYWSVLNEPPPTL